MIFYYYMKDKGYHAVFDFHTGADEPAVDASTLNRLSVNRALLRSGFLQGEVPSEFHEIGAVGKLVRVLLGCFSFLGTLVGCYVELDIFRAGRTHVFAR